MWRNVVTFINHYDIKWFPADFAFVSDILANGMWGSKYYEMFSFFGIQPSAVNAALSLLELVRIGVLLYQRTVERKAEGSVAVALEPEKKLRND